MLTAVGVIPARYASSRLPGKPLVDLQGKPLLYHVYHRARRARSLGGVWIATDDERIAKVAESFGAPVLLTRGDHRTGTDRIGEAVQGIPADIVVNIQGDEPLIDVRTIDAVVDLLQKDDLAEMSTLRTPIRDVDEVLDPNVVKVVTGENDFAVYFSRSPVPYPRLKDFPGANIQELLRADPGLIRHFYKHIGLYAYRRDFLVRFTGWQPTPLEIAEDLEQLRAIEHGAKIKVGLSDSILFGIDTPEDLERIRTLVGNNPKLLET